MLGEFHFLRPWWLLLVAGATGLLWLWQRRTDPRVQWGDTIAPHLLEALIVGKQSEARWRPVHLAALAMALSGIAIAGPTWRKEPPPFGEDRAPMVVAIDLSPTMNATDVAPTRLERVKQKLHDLLELRSGARTGLVVYAGTAHLVVPPTEDPQVLAMFLDALDPDLMPVAGKNALQALQLGDHLLDTQPAPGTLLFFTDGFAVDEIPAFAEERRRSPHQVLALGVGTAKGGPIRTREGGVATDASGRPVLAGFDAASLRRLSSEASVPVASVTLDDSDLKWVERRAQRHLLAIEEQKVELRWRESGYWLTLPIALLAALWFRRGWIVRWLPVLLLAALVGTPAPSRTADLGIANLFFTPDQQGRWYFEHGDYRTAGARFVDPMWKGLALYRAADYDGALGEFARLDSPESFFLMGNCDARLKDYSGAIAAYDNALAARPEFPEAQANRAIAADLLAKQKREEQPPPDPNEKPDDVKFDRKGKRGKKGLVDAPKARQMEAELWMRNLQVSPAEFLREKFRVQAEEDRHRPEVNP